MRDQGGHGNRSRAHLDSAPKTAHRVLVILWRARKSIGDGAAKYLIPGAWKKQSNSR